MGYEPGPWMQTLGTVFSYLTGGVAVLALLGGSIVGAGVLGVVAWVIWRSLSVDEDVAEVDGV